MNDSYLNFNNLMNLSNIFIISIISINITLLIFTNIYKNSKYHFINECKIMEYYMIITSPH